MHIQIATFTGYDADLDEAIKMATDQANAFLLTIGADQVQHIQAQHSPETNEYMPSHIITVFYRTEV